MVFSIKKELINGIDQLDIKNKPRELKMAESQVMLKCFNFTVDTDRIKVTADGSDRFFRHSAPNQRAITHAGQLKITLLRVTQQIFINGIYVDVGLCDLTLDFPGLVLFGSFIQEIVGVGYGEVGRQLHNSQIYHRSTCFHRFIVFL